MSGQLNLALPSGGSVTVAAPDSASDTTVTLPAGNSTLGIQGPAFSAYASVATSMSSGTWTKIRFQTEEWDTANCFDNTTNYRFTPNVAGYYQVTGGFFSAAGQQQIATAIYKNGSGYKYVANQLAASSVLQGSYGSGFVYLNGTTDYIEIYGYVATTANTAASSTDVYFQASMVRTA